MTDVQDFAACIEKLSTPEHRLTVEIVDDHTLEVTVAVTPKHPCEHIKVDLNLDGDTFIDTPQGIDPRALRELADKFSLPFADLTEQPLR